MQRWPNSKRWDRGFLPPSLADLPNHSSREYLHLQEKRPSISPWKIVLKACRTPRTSDKHDFEFSSTNSTPKSQKNQYSDEFCPADKLFYKGQLLPLSSRLKGGEFLSDVSLPARQDSQSSNSSSTSQSSLGSSKSADSAAEVLIRSPLRIKTGSPRFSGQKPSSWQYFGWGLLRSPEISWSSTATLRSQYSSSSSSSGKSRVRVSQEECRNPKGETDFPSVKRREESGKGWRILTSIVSYGNGCKDTSAAVAEAHRSKPRESNSQIGRFNCRREI